MPYIGKKPVIGNFVKLDAISVVNGQAAYTMNNGGSAFTNYDNVNQFLVSLNGVLQAPTDSFTVAGSTLTFASNLATGDVIDFVIVLGNTLDIGTPSDNTVSLAKLTASGTKDATTFLRGDNSFAVPSGGKVLQVVSTVNTAVISTTSTSYVSTGLAASITPSATSSKVLVMAGGVVYNNIADKKYYGTIYRDSTDLGNNAMYIATNNASTFQANLFAAFLDSPSTTSSTTYTYYHKVDSGVTGYISIGNYTSTITLIEIGA